MRKSELEVKIRDLEAQNKRAEMQLTNQAAPAPSLAYEARVAIRAVSMMLENQAEHIAISRGADVENYEQLVREARSLRDEAYTAPGRFIDNLALDEEAQDLYARLTYEMRP